MSTITFTVPGRPRPKGSQTWVPKGGKAVPMPNDKLVAWTGAVMTAAADAMGGRVLFQGSVKLYVVFMFSRPKTHYRTGQYWDKLKPSAPSYHLQKPDTSKLIRAIEDALIGVVYKDDSQIRQIIAEKRWVARDLPDETHVTIHAHGS